MCEAGHILLDPTIVPAEAEAFVGERIPLRPVRRLHITTLVDNTGRRIRGRRRAGPAASAAGLAAAARAGAPGRPRRRRAGRRARFLRAGRGRAGRRRRAPAAVRHRRQPGRDGREHAPAGAGPGHGRGGGLLARSLRPHHRPGRAQPGARREREPAGADPPRVLVAPADRAARPGAVGAAGHQPRRAGGHRLRDRRAAGAVVPVRRQRAGHRRGAADDRLRAGLRDPPGAAERELGAGPADPRRPGAGRAPGRARAGRRSPGAGTPAWSTSCGTRGR